MENRRRELARQYLLGELPEQESLQFEEQCFVDDKLFHEMTGLENELLDAFVGGRLSEVERRQFERGYLISPARRVNLHIARTLASLLPGMAPEKAMAEQKPMRFFPSIKNWRKRFAWAAMTAMVLASLSWIAVVDRRLRHEIDYVAVQQVEFRRQEQALRQEIAALDSRLRETGPSAARPRVLGGTLLSLVLTPNLSRSTAAAKTLILDPTVSSVQLVLYIEHDDYSRAGYRAVLENAQGRIWVGHGFKSHAGRQGGRVVAVAVSASLFKRGNYVIKLAGLAAKGKFEDVEDYPFQVVRH